MKARLVKKSDIAVAPVQTAASHRARQGGIVNLRARGVKVSCVLDPIVILSLDVPVGIPRVLFAVAAGELELTGHVAAKGLRRTRVRIAELGVENVTCVLQAKLATNSRLEEVGVSAQPKVKPAVNADR